MKNWKTTLFGAISALGVYFSTINDPSWMPTVGNILIGFGTFLVGFFAKDSNITNSQNPGPAASVK